MPDLPDPPESVVPSCLLPDKRISIPERVRPSPGIFKKKIVWPDRRGPGRFLSAVRLFLCLRSPAPVFGVQIAVQDPAVFLHRVLLAQQSAGQPFAVMGGRCKRFALNLRRHIPGQLVVELRAVPAGMAVVGLYGTTWS